MATFTVIGLPTDEVKTFLSGAHSDPFRILGPHRIGDDLAVRVFRPDAKKVSIILPGGTAKIPAERIHRDGFFQAILPGAKRDCDYQLSIVREDGSEQILHDPYCYGTFMGEVDLHLFAEGNHLELYKQFGAHLRTINGEEGVYF